MSVKAPLHHVCFRLFFRTAGFEPTFAKVPPSGMERFQTLGFFKTNFAFKCVFLGHVLFKCAYRQQNLGYGVDKGITTAGRRVDEGATG